MIKLGITGGIGSGKTVVSEIFRVMDIPVFDADTEAKKLNDTSSVVRGKLTSHFGEDLYSDGILDKKKFAQIIFSSEENTRIANSIIHPELAKEYNKWADAHMHHPFTVIDAALLLEAGYNRFVDKVITVLSPENLRVERVQKRDNLSLEQIEARMSKQMSNEEKIRLSDFLIYNDNKHSLLLQVNEVLHKLRPKIS